MSPRPSTTSRAAIVRSATELLDAEGIEAFSMRRLAASMGVDPMTIYYHLHNKAALFDAVVDHLWSTMPYGDVPPGAGWQEVARDLAIALRNTLLEHPRLIPLIGTRPAVTPTQLTVVDTMIERLVGAGLRPDASMRLLDCVVAYVVGKVQAEVRRPVGGVDVSTEQALESLDPDAHPHLMAALAAGYGWAPEAEFTRGLAALLSGWSHD